MKRAYIVVAIFLAASSAKADSCISLSGRALENKCTDCREVTVRELHPHEARAANGLFTGVSHTIRLSPNQSEALAGNEHWAIENIQPCH